MQIRELEYEGRIYRVSEDGTVFYDDKPLHSFLNPDGYRLVAIKTTKGWRSIGVHRLVALAFIVNNNFDVLCEVNHKDYNRDNNHYANLEWISHADNVRYSMCNKPDISGENNPNYGNKKLSSKYAADKALSKIKQGRPGLSNGRCRKIAMYKDNALIKVFPYQEQCFEYLINEGISKTHNTNAIRSQVNRAIRKNKSYKGFVFIKY